MKKDFRFEAHFQATSTVYLLSAVLVGKAALALHPITTVIEKNGCATEVSFSVSSH